MATATKTRGKRKLKPPAKAKTKKAPAKAKQTKKAAPKKAAAKKTTTKQTTKTTAKKNDSGRHRGRRQPALKKDADKHLRQIKALQKERRKVEAEAKKAVTELAKEIDRAMKTGVQTNAIAETLGISRQMVYKLVRERVDGKPLNKAKSPQNGAKSTGRKKAPAKAKAKKAPAKKKAAAKK